MKRFVIYQMESGKWVPLRTFMVTTMYPEALVAWLNKMCKPEYKVGVE